jgi:ATP-dependent Clp protease ATP-binding subunit ClpA
VIDEAGAFQRLQAAQQAQEGDWHHRDRGDGRAIARIPPKSAFRPTDKESLRNLEGDLKMLVFGQDQAIDALASAIKLSRAGLKAPEKPIGCFLFAGSTGVGKTEVSRSWPRSWASNWCASTCPSTWNATPSRG